jgi:hypothetical protein
MSGHLFDHADDCECGVCTWDAYPPEVKELALLFAHRRTGGSVFMDGRHNPNPTEVRDAKRFCEWLRRKVEDETLESLVGAKEPKP